MIAPSGYLLDTNVISETRKTRMDSNVLAFLSQTDPDRLYISVLSLGELRKGVEIKQKTDPDAATVLTDWVDGLERMFTDRIIPIDGTIANLWGKLSADRSRPVIDTLIAATAMTHNLVLVSRNLKDLQGIPVPVLDPWTE